MGTATHTLPPISGRFESRHRNVDDPNVATPCSHKCPKWIFGGPTRTADYLLCGDSPYPPEATAERANERAVPITSRCLREVVEEVCAGSADGANRAASGGQAILNRGWLTRRCHGTGGWPPPISISISGLPGRGLWWRIGCPPGSGPKQATRRSRGLHLDDRVAFLPWEAARPIRCGCSSACRRSPEWISKVLVPQPLSPPDLSGRSAPSPHDFEIPRP